jgi:NAD(P)-dependent dehydrogenase (short-subunit alcohol dehydrogenase family)
VNPSKLAPHGAIASQKLAVITGGADGIGLAAAQRFAAEGMRVALLDCDAERLAAARETFEAGGGGVTIWPVDVADRPAVETLAATLVATLGPPAVLMNNAAIGAGGDVFADPSAWERLIAVNLMGVFHGVNAFVPAMIESGAPGLVINTGSKQGITQPPGNTAYNVSKTAVKSLTEGLAHSLRERTAGRVSAHLLVPGFTYTGMMRAHFDAKPPGAWTSEQVVDCLLAGIAQGAFYIICPDNETTAEMDARRIAWTCGDMIENRPALSRWHPDYREAFDAFMAAD